MTPPSVRILATFAEDNLDALMLDPHTSSELLWRVAEAAAAPASATGPAAFTEGRALQHCLPLLYALARRHAGLANEGGKDDKEDQEQRGASSDGGDRRRSRSNSPSGAGASAAASSDAKWSPRDFARALTALAALKYTEPDALAALAEACRPLLRSMRARELGRLGAALGGGGLYLGGGGGGRGDVAAAAAASGAGPPAARPAPGWLAAYMAAAAPALAAGSGIPATGSATAAIAADAARCLWGLARLGVRPSAAWMGAYWSAVAPMLMAMAVGGAGQGRPGAGQEAAEAQALVLLAEALAEARFVAGGSAVPPSLAAASAAGTPAAVASALWPRALLDALSPLRLAALGAPAQAALLSALARVRLAPSSGWLSAFARATLPSAAAFAPWQAAGCVEALGALVVVQPQPEQQSQGAGAGGSALSLASGGGGGKQQHQESQMLLLPEGLGEWLAAALAAVEAQLPQLGARELAALLRGLARLLPYEDSQARQAAARALPLLMQRAAGQGDNLLRRFGAGDLAGLQQSAVAVWLRSGGSGGEDDGPLSDAWLALWCAEATQKLPVMSASELVRVLDGLAATLAVVGEGADAAGDAAVRTLARDAAAMLEGKRSVLSEDEARVADLALERLAVVR
jgi:hypothetical protein